MFDLPSVPASFALSGDDNFISFYDLISLYLKIIHFSHYGKTGYAFCKEIMLTDEPTLLIHSLFYQEKYRSWKLKDFDFIQVVEL